MSTKPMTYEEAARILDPETNLEALRAYAGDCEARQAAIVEACRMGARALRAMPSSEPLTAEQLRRMHFERVWFVYPPQYEGDTGGCEEGVVLYGKLYSIDTLEGAGFEEMLLDADRGDDPDYPSEKYQVFRQIAGEAADAQ